MRIVIALGGNALQRPGEPLEADVLLRNVQAATAALTEIVAAHDVVITHGNAPQIGLLALQADAYRAVRPYPLDVLGAESEGMIGYLIERELANCLPGQEICSLLTRVLVDPDDQAFASPIKPIGPIYGAAEARQMGVAHGWTMAGEGDAFRRVVASPLPLRILESRIIDLLLGQGITVVCAGGGGIPLVMRTDGTCHGIEAVVDKDRTSALLARRLNADALLILTDIDALYGGWNTAEQKAFGQVAPDLLRRLTFAPGSMAPKVAAACDFVETTQGFCAIGRLEDAPALLERKAGTIVACARPKPIA